MFAIHNSSFPPKPECTLHISKESVTVVPPRAPEPALQKLKTVDSRKLSDATLVESEFGPNSDSGAESITENEPLKPSGYTATPQFWKLQTQHAPSPSDKLHTFTKSLACCGANVYHVASPAQLKLLLDIYHAHDNPLPPSDQAFPYLHGLTLVPQRAYYHPRLDPAVDLPLLAHDSDTIVQALPEAASVAVPDMGLTLLAVNTLAKPGILRDAVDIADLLVADTSGYKPFSHVLETSDSDPLERASRNYRLQIHLAAPLAHFLVFNNDMDVHLNLEAAGVILRLMGPTNKNIYLVDFEPSQWTQLGPYLQTGSLDESYHLKLACYEQNLIWRSNNLKQLFPRFHVGNIYNYKRLQAHARESGSDPFSLYVYCHEHAELPLLSTLRGVFADIARGGLRKPLHIEFPHYLSPPGQPWTLDKTLRFLNVLKLVNLIVNGSQQHVMVYLFDGFSVSSVLVLSLALFWGSDHLEEVACRIFRKPYVNIFLDQQDFAALKDLEPFIQWAKRQPKTSHVIDDLPLHTIQRDYRAFTKNIDWFGPHGINFPSQIHNSLFLGSVHHASSSTVLGALLISKIVAVGEQPAWFKALKCTFEHDATPSTPGPIVKPIYTGNGIAVYEIKIGSPAIEAQLFHRLAKYPALKTIVYVHNVRDDGRDLLAPLLLDCPEWVQEKLLVGPEDERTLVHCRIGVSRSATLAIASVMKHFRMGVVDSYLHVRVRRFDVIIQPNLRLFYELFLYDQKLRLRLALLRQPCWWIVCHQIHRLNEQYIR